MTSMLPAERFAAVIRDTPLVSIDLVVVDAAGRALLGQRLNKPAQGHWFVPGGRILKDETLANAFSRLLRQELGLDIKVSATFLGVYQHFYADGFAGDNVSTHYVVLAYRLVVEADALALPLEQHARYQWFDPESICSDALIHPHSRWYFEHNHQADFTFALQPQYECAL